MAKLPSSLLSTRPFKGRGLRGFQQLVVLQQPVVLQSAQLVIPRELEDRRARGLHRLAVYELVDHVGGKGLWREYMTLFVAFNDPPEEFVEESGVD